MGYRSLYVTGTDTGIGKTVASSALLHALRLRGLRAVGKKPLASGCEHTAAGWHNEDALALQAASAPRPEYADLNPYALPLPLANESMATIVVQHAAAGGRRSAALFDECARVLLPGGRLWLFALNPLSPYRWRWNGNHLSASEPICHALHFMGLDDLTYIPLVDEEGRPQDLLSVRRVTRLIEQIE